MASKKNPIGRIAALWSGASEVEASSSFPPLQHASASIIADKTNLMADNAIISHPRCPYCSDYASIDSPCAANVGPTSSWFQTKCYVENVDTTATTSDSTAARSITSNPYIYCIPVFQRFYRIYYEWMENLHLPQRHYVLISCPQSWMLSHE